MLAGPDLVSAVSARVADAEMARRIPDWDGRDVPRPAALPPLTMLAGQTFPRFALARRLRFLQVMGWYPDPPPTVVLGLDPPPPPEATLEDHLAAIMGARAVTAPATEPGTDAAVKALIWALREGGPEVPQATVMAEETATLRDFFDQQADGVDPAWRRRWGQSAEATAAGVSAWARLEATTLAGDRFFGRRPPLAAWAGLSSLVWRLAERRRRRWG